MLNDLGPLSKLLPKPFQLAVRTLCFSKVHVIDGLVFHVQQTIDTTKALFHKELWRRSWTNIFQVSHFMKCSTRLTHKELSLVAKTEVMGGMARRFDHLQGPYLRLCVWNKRLPLHRLNGAIKLGQLSKDLLAARP